MKKVATAVFTVSQLIEGPQGNVGPYIMMTKWADDLKNANSITYWAGTEDGAPYKNLTFYKGLWYACKSKYTRTSSSNTSPPPNLTSRWEVMLNYTLIASEVIFSERGFIELLQSQSIKVMDDNLNLAKVIISGDGITFNDYDAEGTRTAYLRIDRGTIGYYKADGTAIWQLGAAGVINVFGSGSNGWTPKSLYKLGTSVSAATTNAQVTTNFTGTTYYQLTSKAASNTNDLGYTQKAASTAGAAIDNGYYCSPGPPMETIKEVADGDSYYTRTVLRYVSGYLADSFTVTWKKT